MTLTELEQEQSIVSDTVLVAIGASAGGFEALIRMFGTVPAGGNIAYVVIQHLDPDHDSVMAELLDRKTELDVRQATHAERVRPGTIYLIPPGTGMRMRDDRLQLVPFAEPRGIRRPIDDFFLSMAEQGNHRCAGVILSGTGGDGAMGLQALKESGALTIVQTPDEAKYDGMPRAALHTGAVDRVLDAVNIVPTLRMMFEPDGQTRLPDLDLLAPHLPEICRMIREATGHDFSGYKRPTLLRRIERRMQLTGSATPAEYLRHLAANPEEPELLFREILINVTRFFRDLEHFEVLARRAIDPLIASAASGEAVRIWVPGCSSGEEAYTIAMLCQQAAERYDVQPQLQIFATDIDEESLAIARLGRYPVTVLADIPEPFRSRYVDISQKEFQISQRLRDTVRFSNHNLIRDPAFSRMDLISCRNLFIYFDDKTQRGVVPLLHFSLRPSGYLFLGPSESVSDHDKLFASLDRHARLYRKRDVQASYPIDFVTNNGLIARAAREPRVSEVINTSSTPLLDVSTRRILEHYAPATVTLNERGEIVGSSGKLARYFEFSGYQGRELAISVARKGLREIIGPLLRSVQSERARVTSPGIEVLSEFGRQTVDLIADPMTDGHVLLVFSQTADFQPTDKVLDDLPADEDVRLHDLEEELQQIRLRLRTTIEELETANEELKSSNEEMMSMNEELQSTNEELSTTNDELKLKIDQLDVLNSDLRNFFVSADLAVVILSSDLRVRAFTPRINELMPLRESDKGRLLSEISLPHELEYVSDSHKVLKDGKPVERLMSLGRSDKTYMLRILPYTGFAGKIEGVTLTFLDVTELKRSQDQLSQEQQRLKLALKIGKAGVFELDRNSRSILIDSQATELLGIGQEGSDNHQVSYLHFINAVHQDHQDEVRSAFDRAFNSEVGSFDLIFRSSQGRWLRLISVIGDHAVALCQDYTIMMDAERLHQTMLREMNHRIKNLFSVISSILRTTAPRYSDVGEFVNDARQRISALARANLAPQELANANTLDLRELAEMLLEAHPIENIVIDGPKSQITAREATSLSLILHEWATNASKYGALSTVGGKVKLSWSETETEITLNWIETGADLTEHAEKHSAGFGTELVTIASAQLKAQLTSALTPDGFSAELKIPRRSQIA